MGFVDTILGRKKLKGVAKNDRLFAMSTARITLETELGLKSAGAAAVIFKPQSSGEFVRSDSELQQLLDVASGETGTKIERRTDDLGFVWLIVRDKDFEDLVTTTHLISSEFKNQGFDERLLAAAFKFESGTGPVYWIYGFKQGKFWPFVPKGEGQQRDNAKELELKAQLEKELPIEPDLTRWLALFDAPI